MDLNIVMALAIRANRELLATLSVPNEHCEFAKHECLNAEVSRLLASVKIPSERTIHHDKANSL